MALNLEKYSKEELQLILKEFQIPSKTYSFTPLKDGLINDTYLVSANDLPQYILQRINNRVFENVEGLMLNINRTLKQLKSKEYQQPTFAPTTQGKTYFSHNSGYWRVVNFIADSVTYNTTNEPNTAYEAGRIIGAFHTQLQEEKIERYVETIPKFHDLELRKMQFLAALARAPKEKKALAKTCISFAENTFERVQEMTSKPLPLRICHNDTKLNNILFSKETNKALCLIDLDTVMKGYFMYDFGDAARTIINTAAEDEQDHVKITFEKSLFEAFLNGLKENSTFLSRQEVQSLPNGVILMPFLHGLRALTDYLNNDKYYQVAYETQNLERCSGLFNFTKKAIDQLAYLKNSTASILLKS